MEDCADGYSSIQSCPLRRCLLLTPIQPSVNKGLIEKKESNAVKQAQFCADYCDCVCSLITRRDGVVSKEMEYKHSMVVDSRLRQH